MAAGLQRQRQVQLVAADLFHITVLEFAAERFMYQAHHLLLVFVTHAVEKQRTCDADLQTHSKSSTPGRQCQALWAATTVT
ncbi:hypothetical protein D3C71_1559600 [compost metagenome]